MTKTTSAPIPYARAAYILVSVCWLAETLLQITAPAAGAQRFHLGELQINLLKLSYLIPILAVWLFATYGAMYFKRYANMLTGSSEARAMHLIANALFFTIAYLIVTSLFEAIMPFCVSLSIYPLLVVLRDHVAAFLTLLAFIIFYRGAHLLRLTADFETWTRLTTLIMTGFAVFAFGFILRFSTQPVTAPGTAANATSQQYISPGILLFTLILPYLLAWFLGILAAINIAKYAKVVKGVIYKRALKDLVKGLSFVVTFSIVEQLLVLVSRQLQVLTLGPILVLIYGLVVLYALGFVFIRAGAARLAQIEGAQ